MLRFLEIHLCCVCLVDLRRDLEMCHTPFPFPFPNPSPNPPTKHNITVGQVMKDGDFLESSNKRFRLLFFSPDSSNFRYLGIQFMNVSDDSGQDKIVWVANRGKPLRGTLNISHDGNLMLTDYNGTFITLNAEEQPVPSNDTSATLLDTGNLVLRARKHIVWQSFDYPSDTWLPGMKLGLFKSSRGQPQHCFLISQVSPEVPTPGAFTLGVDPNNTKKFVIWQRGVPYWRSGMWNGYNFSYFPSSNNEFNFSYFSDESQSYFTFTRTDNDFPSWIDIDSSGTIRIVQIEHYASNYVQWSSAPYCCDDCQGLEYSYNFGCVAPNPSNCTAGDVFIKKSGSTYSWAKTNNVSQGISDCKEICRQDCACTAYASALSDGSGCQFFYGEYSDSPEYIFYIRNISMANIASPLVAPSYPVTQLVHNNLFPNDHNNTTLVNLKKKRLWFTIRNNRRSEDRTSLGTQSFMSEMKTEATNMEKINNGKKDHELPLFSLSSIEIAADYFSDANKIGQGGFGPVYKGKFFNGQEIAVKRLSRSSGQGLEEFKNEVTLISRLQHHEIGRASLNWKIRVSIIEGIAQGLQYLHKYSRQIQTELLEHRDGIVCKRWYAMTREPSFINTLSNSRYLTGMNFLNSLDMSNNSFNSLAVPPWLNNWSERLLSFDMPLLISKNKKMSCFRFCIGEDHMYMKALYHALPMSYVTLIDKMIHDGFLDAKGSRKLRKRVIHSDLTKKKLMEIKKTMDIDAMDGDINEHKSSHAEFQKMGSINRDMSTCGVFHSIGSDLTRTRGRFEAHQNGSIRSEQTVSRARDHGNTPTSRAEPVASRESFVPGNENARANGNADHFNGVDTGICSMSTQDKRSRKASTVKEPILQYMKRQKSQAL
ncbi:unnamed protein product [Camellia sinensis]